MLRAQARLAQWVKNREQAESELTTAEDNLRMQRQAVTALEEDRRQAQESRSRLDAERSRLTAQTEVLEQAERSLSGLATARAIFTGSSPGTFRRLPRLSSALVVPADLEAAIAAALGEFLDSVLVEKGVDLEDALQSLDKGEQGRAVLLPLNEARQKDVLKAAKDEGCLGVAAELIQAPAELQDAVRLLLGQVLVARDRTAARKLARALPETARVVTLQGEVFLGNGAVVAGRENKTSSLIRRTRRIQECACLWMKGKNARRCPAKTESAGRVLQSQRSKEKELDGLVHQAQSGLSKANQGYQQAVLETEQVKQKQDYRAPACRSG
jgi:chromosome segregation protein